MMGRAAQIANKGSQYPALLRPTLLLSECSNEYQRKNPAHLSRIECQYSDRSGSPSGYRAAWRG